MTPTKYAHLTNEELLRQWYSLEPLYLLEEAHHRFEILVKAAKAHDERYGYELDSRYRPG